MFSFLYTIDSLEDDENFVYNWSLDLRLSFFYSNYISFVFSQLRRFKLGLCDYLLEIKLFELSI
jgi:hypothetical protein